jgi:hypothetical protein
MKATSSRAERRKLCHQPAHGVAVHAGERLDQLFAMPGAPGAMETSVVFKILICFGFHGALPPLRCASTLPS